MQTFRKLPKTRPNSAANTISSGSIVVGNDSAISSESGFLISVSFGYSKPMHEDVEAPSRFIEAENHESTRAAEEFARAVALMRRLRGPDGCPWDREQTLKTIRRYTVEEVYEVLDAIDRSHWSDLREELGDLALQILFYAQIAGEEGHFDIADVLAGLNQKLVRRHPHVFGEEASAAAGNAATLASGNVTTPAHVLQNWEAIKKAEKSSEKGSHSLLDSVPRTFPALLESAKIGAKAARVGFDWPGYEGVLEKLHEEVKELQEAAVSATTENQAGRIEEELGDLLFTAANLARHFKVDPEVALRAANSKFRRRFAHMEISGNVTEGLSSEELEALWTAAKLKEQMVP